MFENKNIEKYWWLNEESQTILNNGYLLKGETTEDAVKRITTSAAKTLDKPELQPIFEDLIAYGIMSCSTPVWANLGTSRGLPISCFNVNISDSIESITDKLSEVIIQTKIGGGTSAYFGNLRGRGVSITDNGVSSGAVSFMKLFDSAMDTVSQGSTRRGAFASYLNIDHLDIEEFLKIKDIGNPIQNLFFGVTVPDWWLIQMINGDVEKRDIWAKVLKSRQEKGLPYILFSDNVNKNKPDIYKKLDEIIYSSNLCTEILLPSNEDESFVCCLASMNLELYDIWKNTKAVYYATYFLDAVMQEFIDKSENIKHLDKAHNFAKRHRALGLGVLGLHSYYQKIGRAFGDFKNIGLNKEIFGHIYDEALKASIKLGKEYGYAPIFNEIEDDSIIKRRNTTLIAIAPTTSSSAILGQVSAGIEPYSSNLYKANLAKGNFIRRNKYLVKLLEEKGQNLSEVWSDIMLNNGSVQHLDFLTDEEKDIFKTFSEISQMDIIIQAAERQKFIDQGQSLNINIPPNTSPKDVNYLILEAWKRGIKTIYYQRSESSAKNNLLNIINCSSCES